MGEFTHSWNGTVLTITSDSGTSSCDLKGEKGDDGVRGAQGSGIASPQDIDNAVSDYLEEKYPDGFNNFKVDATLSIEGQPADAKATGDAIANISIDTATIIDLIYPVGSIYMSTDSNNPELKWEGTTWIAWGSGRVPVGVDSGLSEFETVEKTGGHKDLQGHSHGFTPEGTLNGMSLTGSTSSGKTGIGIVATTATGTVVSATATGTVGGTVATMNEAGTHKHIIPHDTRATATSGDKKAVMLGYSKDGTTTASYTNRYSSETGEHTHVINSHGHPFVGSPHSHTFTPNAHNHSITDNGHTHAVTINAHTHTFTGKDSLTGMTGSGNSGNLQPYITCYMWKRTA